MQRIDSDIVGDEGERLAHQLLEQIAYVTPQCKKDIGLDFHCRLREKPAFQFWVQAKGSHDPTYGANHTISSLSVDRRTIEEIWLEDAYPVFVFMSDTLRQQTYYFHVTQEKYQPRDSHALSHVFPIPLENEITRDNIGKLVSEVVYCQPSRSEIDAQMWVERYRQQHPLLHQDLTQIDTLIEAMRSSDQSAEVEAKYVIRELFEAGKLYSARLTRELRSTFSSCRDVIAQSHVLDALIFLQDKQVVPDVIRQISNNLSLDVYQRAHPEHRARYTSFLFAALARLEARNVLPDLKVYFRYPEPHVVQEAVFACGELKPIGGARDLLPLLSHPDANVRIVTAQALGKYGHKYITQTCLKALSSGHDSRAVHGAIYTLAYLKNRERCGDVVAFADHEDSCVRQAVAHYLGFVDVHEYADLLASLVGDDDLYVRSQAGTSFVDSLTLPDAQKEQLVLTRLVDAFERGEETKAASLLGIVNRVGSEAAKPVLLRIYWEDDGKLTNYTIRDVDGSVRGKKAVDLKSQALGVLGRFDVPEIHDDIINQITHADEEVAMRYIDTARNLRLPDAFDAITSIRDEYLLSLSGSIVTALLELDREQAVCWALSRISDKPSLPVCLVCCSILELTEREKEVAELIGEHLWKHFQNPDNRLVALMYRYIRRYRVLDATPIIIEDLEAGRCESLQEVDAFLLIRQMLETLGTIGGQQGRDYLIALLAQVGRGFKIQILNLLASIGDGPSILAIDKCRYDPTPDVRVVADRSLVQSSRAKHA